MSEKSEIPSPWSPEAEGGPFRPARAPELVAPGVVSLACRFPVVRPGDGEVVREALPTPSLTPGMERAVPKRRLEFVAGRLAAREALKRLGRPGEDWLVRGDDRAPVWPTDYVGSITHTRGLAWVVAAPIRARRGLGSDLEAVLDPRSVDAVSRLVMFEEDRAGLVASGLSERVHMTLVFGAKECLFKCLYPTVRKFFGFEAARVVEVEPGGGRFRIRLAADLHPELLSGQEWEGSFQLLEPTEPDGPRIMATSIEWA